MPREWPSDESEQPLTPRSFGKGRARTSHLEAGGQDRQRGALGSRRQVDRRDKKGGSRHDSARDRVGHNRVANSGAEIQRFVGKLLGGTAKQLDRGVKLPD
jgi:hypothetical protein